MTVIGGRVGLPEQRRSDWPALLEDAIRGSGLSSVYQPIIDVARGQVAGYEALSRFERGPENPEEWFAAARRYGVEADLDAAALRSALAQRSALPRNAFLSINVTPASLADPCVRAVWAEQDALGGLIVELTEQTPIESYVGLQPDINRLRASGALIAVDDAGAGYAGLQHLLALRPEVIKLDRQLIADIDLDESKRALTEMLGTFADRIDAWLLAKGIERPGELRVIADLGVPLAQGFHLGRPELPWIGVEPAVVELLAAAPRGSRSDTLRAFVQAAPSVRDSSEIGSLFDDPAVDIVVMVDGDARPVGTVTSDTSFLEAVEPVLRINVDTPLTDAALRAITRALGSRFAPLLCTDAAGRYVGVVHMERLIQAIAALAEPPPAAPPTRLE